MLKLLSITVILAFCTNQSKCQVADTSARGEVRTPALYLEKAGHLYRTSFWLSVASSVMFGVGGIIESQNSNAVPGDEVNTDVFWGVGIGALVGSIAFRFSGDSHLIRAGKAWQVQEPPKR